MAISPPIIPIRALLPIRFFSGVIDGIDTLHRASISVPLGISVQGVDFGYLQALLVEKRHWLSNRRPSYSQRYSIDIDNSSLVTLTNVLVTDLLPDMLRFSHTNSANGTPTGGQYDSATHQITWTLSAIGPGSAVELAVFGYVNGSAQPGTALTNEVWVDSDDTTRAIAWDTFGVVAPESTVTPSATPTASSTATPAATATATVTSTPTSTPTATPLTDLSLAGHVYDADLGVTGPISDAQISLISCLMERFTTTTSQDGSYSLVVPLSELDTCTYVVIECSSSDHETLSFNPSVTTLLAQPIVDFWLPPLPPAPTPQPIRLPLLLRFGG